MQGKVFKHSFRIDSLFSVAKLLFEYRHEWRDQYLVPSSYWRLATQWIEVCRKIGKRSREARQQCIIFAMVNLRSMTTYTHTNSRLIHDELDRHLYSHEQFNLRANETMSGQIKRSFFSVPFVRSAADGPSLMTSTQHWPSCAIRI